MQNLTRQEMQTSIEGGTSGDSLEEIIKDLVDLDPFDKPCFPTDDRHN